MGGVTPTFWGSLSKPTGLWYYTSRTVSVVASPAVPSLPFHPKHEHSRHDQLQFPLRKLALPYPPLVQMQHAFPTFWTSSSFAAAFRSNVPPGDCWIRSTNRRVSSPRELSNLVNPAAVVPTPPAPLPVLPGSFPDAAPAPLPLPAPPCPANAPPCNDADARLRNPSSRVERVVEADEERSPPPPPPPPPPAPPPNIEDDAAFGILKRRFAGYSEEKEERRNVRLQASTFNTSRARTAGTSPGGPSRAAELEILKVLVFHLIGFNVEPMEDPFFVTISSTD